MQFLSHSLLHFSSYRLQRDFEEMRKAFDHNNRTKRRRLGASVFDREDDSDDTDTALTASSVPNSEQHTVAGRVPISVSKNCQSSWKPRFLPGSEQEEANSALRKSDHDSEAPLQETEGSSGQSGDSEEEDDYMKMQISDSPLQDSRDITYSERRRNRERNQYQKSRPLAPQEAQRQKLKQSLDTPIISVSDNEKDDERGSSSNIALGIMKKMGFVPGKTLGRSSGPQTSIEPIRPNLKYGTEFSREIAIILANDDDRPKWHWDGHCTARSPTSGNRS